MKPDIVVYSIDQRPVLIVEAKKKKGASSAWATKMRRNLFAHVQRITAPFFLLVTSDRLFLWVDSGAPLDAEPDHVADARSIWKRYFPSTLQDLDSLSGYSFEMLVASWLNHLTSSPKSDMEANQVWLHESGLFEAIRDGYVSSIDALEV